MQPTELLANLTQPADDSGEQYRAALDHLRQQPLTTDRQANVALIKATLHPGADVITRDFTLGLPGQPKGTIIHIEGMVDKTAIDRALLTPLMLEVQMAPPPVPVWTPPPAPADAQKPTLAQLVHDRLLPQNDLQEATTYGQVLHGILKGRSALLLDGEATAYIANTEGWKDRRVGDPVSEGVVRGPRDGFTETIHTNTALLRRRLRTPALKIEQLLIGESTCTQVAIAYMQGVVDPQILQEVRTRLGRIKIDGILESGYLEEFLEDTPWSPFPQVEHTERPDKVAGVLLEGRIAIFTDNTPFVLLAPTTLPQFLISAEDYYDRFWVATGVRWVRMLSVGIALLLPSLYVAVTTYQPELIPSSLLFSLAAAREGVPFPAVVEALLMEISLEVLREAGVRLPRPVGQAVSIVGGLVIGEAAVRANIASPAMVIVVALTAIASFAVPAYNALNGVRMLRFGMMLLGATLGIPGIMWGILGLQIHLAGLRSFGVPYLAPLAPARPAEWRDLLVRAPWWSLRRRPRLAGGSPRQPPDQMPSPRQGR